MLLVELSLFLCLYQAEQYAKSMHRDGDELVTRTFLKLFPLKLGFSKRKIIYYLVKVPSLNFFRLFSKLPFCYNRQNSWVQFFYWDPGSTVNSSLSRTMYTNLHCIRWTTDLRLSVDLGLLLSNAGTNSSRMWLVPTK